MLHNLLAGNHITTTPDGWIYPFGRAEFETREREAREPRRRTLLSVRSQISAPPDLVIQFPAPVVIPIVDGLRKIA
jgi:hypothetical protein